MNDSSAHILWKTKFTHFAITAFFVVATAVTVLVFLLVYRIRAVNIENCVYSNKESVMEATEIKLGMHSYAIDKEEMAERIMASNPYICNVHITRESATTLRIDITEDAPRFYISYNGKYIILSETLRVLAECESEAELLSLSVAPIKLPDVEKSELGKTLVFTEEAEEDGKECIELLSMLAESSLSGVITHADFSERFNIAVTYNNKYEIRFGSPKNFADKLSLVIDTIEELENPLNGYSTAKGIIHASVTGETSFEATGAIS